jgi:divalent metal cation (Fe/Co/Zn/Cd) transporter
LELPAHFLGRATNVASLQGFTERLDALPDCFFIHGLMVFATSIRAMDRRALLSRAVLLSAASIVVSALVGGVAVVVALGTESLSLLGFGADAVIDSAASVVLVWRFRTEASQPHRADRVERVAERLVGAVLLLLATYLTLGAVIALFNGSHPDPSLPRFILLVVGVVVLPPLAIAKHRTARDLASAALRADSILTGVAAVLAAIGLVALGLSQLLDVRWADAIGALVVAGIVAREGWSAIGLFEGDGRGERI